MSLIEKLKKMSMISMAGATMTTASIANVEASLENVPSSLSENIKQVGNSDPFLFFNQYDINNLVSEKSDKWHEDIPVNSGSVRRVYLDKIDSETLRKTDISRVKNHFGQSLTTYAALNNQEDALRALGNMNADMNARNTAGYTPLESTLMIQPKNEKEWLAREKTIRTLVQYGADVNLRNTQGDTPLMSMAGKRDKRTMDLLIELGADTQLKNKFGKNALEAYDQNIAWDKERALRQKKQR